MNIADLYPTIQPPYTLDDLTFEYTDTIANLTATYGLNIAHPYVMGYIPIDYTPDWAKISILDAESSEDNYSFKPLGDIDNYPWFFLSVYTTALTSRSTADLIYSSNTWNVLGTSNLQYRFVNGITIQSLAQRDVTLRFGHFSQNRRTNVVIGSTALSSLAIVDYTFSSFSDFKDWLDGTIPYIQISFAVATGITETFKLSAVPNSDPDIIEVGSGMARTTVEETVSEQTDTYDVWAFIADYKLPYQRMIGNNSTSGNYPNLSVALQIHDTENSIDYIADMGDRFANTQPALRMNNAFSAVGGDLSRIVLNDVGYYKGGFSGEFPKNMTSPSIYYTEYNNFVVYKAASYWYFFRCISPYDILKLIQICGTRFTNVSATQFGEDDGIYFPLYNPDNSPKMELLDGSDIDDDLRDWQIYNVNYNEFKWEDVPIYVPPGPGDDSADSSGDDIRPWDFVNTPLSAANNFVTIYALTTAQVSEFGATMWAKLSDTAFWQSVGTVFLNDFSINPADMLKYFVSLRYFPFDLSNYSATYANGIYIGRSTYPIQISTYPRRMQRNLVEINGGSVTVILPSPFNTNDFRNCDPATKVTAYVPYCGIVELSASEVYGKTLYLTYFVDMQTGAISASICVQSNTYYEIATLAGSCGAEVPITANNNIEFLQRIATVASGALSNTISGAAQGAHLGGAPGAVAGGALGALTGSTQALASLPPVTVHKAGKATGFATLGGSYRAHISIQVAKSDIPDSYAHTTGYISNKKARIGDLTGYTEMINPDVTGIDAHADELEKIKATLTTGFYA